MTDRVRYETAAGIATITMDNPPLNALGVDLRRGMAQALEKAEADPDVQVIILTAAGRSWPVGADIKEFGKPPQRPTLPELCLRLAQASKPVIAAIHGSALGGGLELALVCAARVAVKGTVFGLPEVKLGILPGAGGTQRLPRLIGAAAALDMMLQGSPVGAEHALTLGLIDRIAEDDVVGMAGNIASAHVSGRVALAPAAVRQPKVALGADSWLAAIERARAKPYPSHDLAPPRIIDCVEAALLLSPGQGLAFERAAFEDLVATDIAAALRHAFFLERRSSKALPPGGLERALQHVAIIGCGPIGAGLATELLARDVHVTVIAADAEALARGLTRIARGQEAAVRRGEMSDEARQQAWGRLKASTGIAQAADADLVIEAVKEDLAAKERVLKQVRLSLPHTPPVLSVTCGLAGTALANFYGEPSRHASLYVTDPVRKATTVELALPPGADANLIACLRTLAKQMGWRVIRPAPTAGFLGKKLLWAFFDAADRCLSLGALPHEVDRAARQFGWPLGPYELRDIYGTGHVLIANPDRREGAVTDPVAVALEEWLHRTGRTGRKGGAGYHRYINDGQTSQGDPETAAELARLRPRERLDMADIQTRLMAAIANEGAWAITEGRAQTPADIDLVAMGQSYPRWRGGPMQSADAAGLLMVRDQLRAWARMGDIFWMPAPIWDELIRNGRRFAGLNGD